MCVCIASQFLSAGVGGISRVARLTFQAAVDGGYVVQGLAAQDSPKSEGLPSGVEVFSGSRLKFVLACQKALITHKHMIYDFPGTARAHFAWARYLRPYAVWIHGIEVWEELNPQRLKKIAQAHTLFANSHYTKMRASALHGAVFDNAKVCWLGTLEDEAGSVSNMRSNGPPIVLIVGRIERGRDKGHDALIDSWPSVVAALPDARLVMVGNCNRFGEIQEKVARSPARMNIDLAGHVTEPVLASYFANASVYAMPSYGEGFGLVYIEAMRYSLPVITSTTDAGHEVIVDGETGYAVDMDKPEMLTDRLINLLQNRDLAAAMGRQGLDRWRSEFCYSKFRQRFAPMLAEFVEST
jgi:phosphatidylinositol alpha-1,6-mannosyltransferase